MDPIIIVTILLGICIILLALCIISVKRYYKNRIKEQKENISKVLDIDMKILKMPEPITCSNCGTVFQVEDGGEINHKCYKIPCSSAESVITTVFGLAGQGVYTGECYDDTYIECPICHKELVMAHTNISDAYMHDLIREKKSKYISLR